MKDLFLQAPDGHLDASIKPLIEKWDEPNPTAAQVLEVLDHCVYGGLASELAMALFNDFLETAIDRENTTYAEVVAKATWRQGAPFDE